MLHVVAFCLFHGGGHSTDEVDMLPVTFYLPTLATASTDNSAAVYYYAHLCPAGIAGRQQVNLNIFLPNNVDWNTVNGRTSFTITSRMRRLIMEMMWCQS